MYREKLDEIVLKKFQLPAINNLPDMDKWNVFLDKLYNPKEVVDIALVGKYVELQDAYKSIWNRSFTQVQKTNVRLMFIVFTANI